MPAIDLLHEWQHAECACRAAYQAIYAKVQRGAYVDASELAELSSLSHESTCRYHRYLESVSDRRLPEPAWEAAADAERAKLPGPHPRRLER